VGDPRFDPTIFDDDELATAMRESGNVYLGMFARVGPPGADTEKIFDRAVERVCRDSSITRHQVAASMGQNAAPGSLGLKFDRALIACAIEGERRFGMNEAEVKAWLQANRAATDIAVRENLPWVKRMVAIRAARAFFDQLPEDASVDDYLGRWSEFSSDHLPTESAQALSADREILLSAFRNEIAFRRWTARAFRPLRFMADATAIAYDCTWPLEKFIDAARGVGLVSFDAVRSGGVLRSLPVLVGCRSSCLWHLGPLVARDASGIDAQPMYRRDHTLLVGEPTPIWRLPLDRNGECLLNWVLPSHGNNWLDTFRHIPVIRLLHIAENRRAIEDNQRRLAIAMAELVKARHAETPAEFERYAELVNQRMGMTSPRAENNADLESVNQRITEMEADARDWLERRWKLWRDDTPRTDDERRDRGILEELYQRFGGGRLDAQFNDIAQRLNAESATLMDELRPMIAGNICLVGYTASAEADLVTSPAFSGMPGVMAHANFINTLLQNRIPKRAAPLTNSLLIALTGLLITVLTCVRGPVVSFILSIVLAALVFFVGGFIFRQTDLHLATLVAASSITLPWASVTAYRQMTEERSRRRFQRALAQYTSPVIAARIAAEAATTDLAPRPATVTCFFSDLQGFTRISEQLGPERTRALLNPYLEAMSRVLTDHRAIVSKFIGDGVFAFFNAPIWPCDDHAEAACAAALDSVAALDRLNRERGDPSLPSLSMRIGIATGDVFVGDYGSDRKLDYTCIGDAVNLASRLEGLSKVLGTHLLVDESTAKTAGGTWIFRWLGRIRVAGRAQPVSVSELIARGPSTEPRLAQFVERFNAGVRDYQSCEWDRSRSAFERCQELRPSDGAVAIYLAALAQFSRSDPPRGWDGTLDLSGDRTSA